MVGILLSICDLNSFKLFSHLSFRRRNRSLFLGFGPFWKFFMQNFCIILWSNLSKPSGMLQLNFFHVEWLEFVTFLLVHTLLSHIKALFLYSTLVVHLYENVIHFEFWFQCFRVREKTIVLKWKFHSVETILNETVTTLDWLVVVFCIDTRTDHTSCVPSSMLPTQAMHASPWAPRERGGNGVLLDLMDLENAPSLSTHWRVISRGSLGPGRVRHLLAIVRVVDALLPLYLFIISNGASRTWTNTYAILIILNHKELFYSQATVSDQTIFLALITRLWRAI